MSFIESCLSLVVVSTVAVIAVPQLLKTTEDYTLKSAARDVATRMHTARIRAITRNTDCRLRVTSARNYLIECETPNWSIEESAAVPRGISLSANARPEFHRYGNVAPTATIILRNAAGRQRKVIVNNGGRIRIE